MTRGKDANVEPALRERPATSATLHGRYITFHLVDGMDETYVFSDLLHALADFAGLKCEESKKKGEVA